MASKSFLFDGTAIAATAGLAIAYGLIQFLISLYRVRSRMLKLRAQGLPMPPYHPIFGHILFVRSITSKVPDDAHSQYMCDLIRRDHPDLGPNFYIDLWPFAPQMLAISSLNALRQVTQDRHLPPTSQLKAFLAPIAGDQGLVTMEGATWKKWRSIYNPGFSRSNLLTLTAGIVDETSIFCEKLHSLAGTGKVLRMKHLTDCLTTDVIGRVVFNVKLQSQTQSNPLSEALQSQTQRLIFAGKVTPLGQWNPIRSIILAWNTWKMNKYILPHLDRQLGNVSSTATKSIIDLASKAYRSTEDATALQPGAIDPVFRSFALNQVKMFLFSGYDTTSSSICWLFYVLARHPEVRDQIRAEHDGIFGTRDAAEMIKEDSSILNRLTYTTAMIKETLRLYPVISITKAGEVGLNVIDDQGLAFPTQDFMVWMNTQRIHRDPELWPQADELIPERWLVPPQHTLHPLKGAWRPFSLGTRNCIAQELAMMEMKVVLAMTARTFDIATAYEAIDKTPAAARQQIYGERGYQIVPGAQPSGNLPCRVWVREQK